MTRTSGILLHITSLPSPYGIGTMGREAYRFLDFLSLSQVGIWQILPLGPTGFGDSPYQSFSTFAGNPYLIDLEELHRQGLLEEEEIKSICWQENPEQVDYERIFHHRFSVLEKAFQRGIGAAGEEYEQFCKEEEAWLSDYALFMAIKEQQGQRPWWEWDSSLRMRDPQAMERFSQDNAQRIAYWKYLQYLFFTQWQQLKGYAASKGIKILGDLPIYVARDSADVWSNPQLFWLDENGFPVEVAGVPPDGFSADGQLWGNPLYRWDVLEKTGFSWWTQRVKHAYRFFDILRMDHFRGFESYYAIPFSHTTAAGGHWCKGPGKKFFDALERELGSLPVIAEDLGFLTPQVHQLLEETGFPGMKVLQFAFEPWQNSLYLPHNISSNCVVYTGTHDNDTSQGFWEEDSAQSRFCREYLGLSEEGNSWDLIRAAWSSTGDIAIAPMQDFLCLGKEARMNTPSTVGGNWRWRLLPGQLTDDLAQKIRRMGRVYSRIQGSRESDFSMEW